MKKTKYWDQKKKFLNNLPCWEISFSEGNEFRKKHLTNGENMTINNYQTKNKDNIEDYKKEIIHDTFKFIKVNKEIYKFYKEKENNEYKNKIIEIYNKNE